MEIRQNEFSVKREFDESWFDGFSKHPNLPHWSQLLYFLFNMIFSVAKWIKQLCVEPKVWGWNSTWASRTFIYYNSFPAWRQRRRIRPRWKAIKEGLERLVNNIFCIGFHKPGVPQQASKNQHKVQILLKGWVGLTVLRPAKTSRNGLSDWPDTGQPEQRWHFLPNSHWNQ